jgi:DNA-binding XRE family transcriptional regulator
MVHVAFQLRGKPMAEQSEATAPKKTAVDFGPQLKKLREEARLTQEHLAERMEMLPLTIRKLEKGKLKPSWSTVVKLSVMLGVEPAAFGLSPRDCPFPDQDV